MRITAQMSAQIQSLNAKLVDWAALLKNGSIEAEIVKVSGGKVLLKLEGDVELKLPESAMPTLKEGDQVKLSLTEQGKLQIDTSTSSPLKVDTPVQSEGQATMTSAPLTDAKTVDQWIVKNGIQPDPMTRQMVSALLEKNIPVTKEALIFLRQNMQAISTVASSVTPMQLPHLIQEMNTSVKQLAITLLTSEAQPMPTTTAGLEGNSAKNIVENLFPSIISDAQPTQKEMEGFKQQLLTIQVNDLLPQMAKQTPLTFKDILFVLNNLNPVWTEKESFETIAKHLSQKPLLSQEVAQLLEVITTPKNESEKINKLEQWLSTLSLDEETKTQIKSEMGFIKENLAMPNKTTSDVYFMQLPIQFNRDEKPVDFYFKRNKRKKEDEDRFSILIALNTHHFSKVNCMIVGDARSIQCTFGLSSESYVKVFEAQQSFLKERIAAITDKAITIQFDTVEENQTSFFEDSIENTQVTGIDIRV